MIQLPKTFLNACLYVEALWGVSYAASVVFQHVAQRWQIVTLIFRLHHAASVEWGHYIASIICTIIWEGHNRTRLGLWGLHLHKKQVLPGRRNNLFTALTNHTHTPGQLLVPRSHSRFSHRPVTQAAPTVLHGLFCQSHSACACSAAWCWRQTAGRYGAQ